MNAPTPRPPQPPVPGPTRWVIGRRTGNADVDAALRQRLELEFGAALDRFDDPEAAGGPVRWTHHADPGEPTHLAAIAEHLRRVEALYAAQVPPIEVRLWAAAVDARRVALVGEDDPHRVPIARGVWAEVALVWDVPARTWRPLPWTPPGWLSTEGLAFWTRVRAAAIAPPALGE